MFIYIVYRGGPLPRQQTESEEISQPHDWNMDVSFLNPGGKLEKFKETHKKAASVISVSELR
jgi:hypothetical protein